MPVIRVYSSHHMRLFSEKLTFLPNQIIISRFVPNPEYLPVMCSNWEIH